MKIFRSSRWLRIVGTKCRFVAGVACVSLALASCSNGTPKANLKDDVDTLSYAIGLSQSEGLKQALAERMGIDTTYIDDFIRGLNEGATAGDDKRKEAYYMGIQIGHQIGSQMLQGLNYEIFGNDSTQSISLKNFLAGFVAGVTEKDQKMTLLQARMTSDQKLNELRAKNLEKEYSEWKKQNEAWLAKNSKAAGVVTLPSGLQYKVITEGKGALPTDTSTVVTIYEGKDINGEVFDSSERHGGKVEFQCNSVIKGWQEALKKMPVGSKWELYIPASLAYGANPQRGIKPFSTLIFTMELVEIK